MIIKNKTRFAFIHRICLYLYSVKGPLLFKKVLAEIANTISRISLPPIKNGDIIETVYKFNLCINKDDGVNYYYNGFYELGTLNIMKNSLKKGDIFIDVGASVGLMSIYASKIVGKTGKVLSFELMQSRFINLKKNILINNCTNIDFFDFGLGADNEKKKYYDTGGINPAIPPILSIFSSEQRRYGMIGFNDDLPHSYIEVRRLDDVIKKEKVAFIKIDVEGYEPYVIQGATKLLLKKEAPIICFEIGGNPMTNDNIDIFNLLRGLNSYRFFKLRQGKKFVSNLIEFNTEDYQIPKSAENIFCFLPYHFKQLPKYLFDYL